MTEPSLIIGPDDLGRADVRALLATHLAQSRSLTPAGYSFALDVEELAGHGIVFVGARRGGVLVGVGALKPLDDRHAELKSMHTLEAFRGRGVGRAIVDHLLGLAAANGYVRVSLETGTSDEFAAARALYARCGFRPCPEFGDYRPSPHNTFMTIILTTPG